MKKYLLIFLLATATMSSTCSKDDITSSNSSSGVISASQVPAAVMSAFNSRYPGATGQIEWEKEDGNTYKVKFFINSQRMQAIFSSAGAFISEKNI